MILERRFWRKQAWIIRIPANLSTRHLAENIPNVGVSLQSGLSPTPSHQPTQD
jgi:hypothetical protein